MSNTGYKAEQTTPDPKGSGLQQELTQIVARHNPEMPFELNEVVGELTEAISGTIAGLPEGQQKFLSLHVSELSEAIGKIILSFAARGHAGKPISVSARGPVERSEGQGFGDVLSPEKGQERLRDFAVPVRLEAWAGAVAGANEIARRFGTPRSTLHAWHKQGAVIGLLKGRRNHVFPLAQFEDGHPLQGIADISQVVGNPRVAWQWLIQDKSSIGGKPLELLRAGEQAKVIAAAKRDFG